MLSRALLLAFLTLTALPGAEHADAAPTTDSGIITDPGPEWQPTQPIQGAVAPEVVMAWWNGSDLLSIFSVPNDACGPQGMDSRTQMSLVAVTFGIPHAGDRDGVSRYDNGGRAGSRPRRVPGRRAFVRDPHLLRDQLVGRVGGQVGPRLQAADSNRPAG